MKHLRQYIRQILIESDDTIAKIERLMKGGDIDMGIELALSMGIPLEEIPWQAEYNTILPEVRAQGIESIIKYLMSRSNLQKPGGWHHPNQDSFKQVFAIADELGMRTRIYRGTLIASTILWRIFHTRCPKSKRNWVQKMQYLKKRSTQNLINF